MYTYVQRPGCKKVNTAMDVHTGGVSNSYSRIRIARARVHGCGWVGTEQLCRRRVHGEATECVVFIRRQWNACCSSGANRLGRNRRWKRGLAYRRTVETALCSTGHGGNGILFIGRGLAYRKTEEMDLLRSKQGPVDREGCGVPQNGGNRLVLERYGRNGGPIHREGCGVPQNGTPRDTVHLHRRPPPASTGSCSSTVDLLQPPPATVHPRAPVHPTSTARSSTGYCSTSPLHGGPVQPPLHGLLFI